MTSQERRDSGKLSTTLRLLEKSCRVRAAGSWRPAVCDPGHMGMQCPPPLDAGGVSVKPSAPAFALLGERGRKELFVSSTDESDPVANKFSGAALNSGSELWFQPADTDTACVCMHVCVCVCVRGHTSPQQTAPSAVGEVWFLSSLWCWRRTPWWRSPPSSHGRHRCRSL